MADLLPFLLDPPTRTPPTTHERPSFETLSDKDARTAALDIQQSWIVEAPAGSGKSGLLIQRYLKLLAFGGVQRPEEVLVLTFTRKADGELRARVLDQLSAAARNEALPSNSKPFDVETRRFAEEVLARDRAQDWHILDSPSRLNVRTIDSFCSELAGSMPLLAGGSRRQPIDDAFQLYKVAAERTLGELGGADQVLSSALAALVALRDAQLPDCVTLVSTMLAQREQWAQLIPLQDEELSEEYLDSQIRPRLERTLQRIVSAGLAQAARALGTDNVRELTAFARNLSTEPGHGGGPNPLANFRTMQDSLSVDASELPNWREAINLVLTGEGGWRKKPKSAHLKLELSKLSASSLEQFIEQLKHRERDHPELRDALCAIRNLPPACYPDEQWPLVKALCRVLRRALAELHVVFAQRGQCDFTEIALAARRLLRPAPPEPGNFNPDPLQTPAARLSHLLVDEMQDTSVGQYELLELLTDSWDGYSQTVFLVGDPKQSIYAFRQARVARFLRTMETRRLRNLPLGALRLTANFRSQANLVQDVNDLFRPIFPKTGLAPTGENDPAVQSVNVPFVQAVPERAATIAEPLHWHILRADETDTSSQDHARQIRVLIERFLEDRARAGAKRPTVAVLARNRNHLAPIIAEFHRDYGAGPLPFHAVDVEALNKRPEVLDLVALTRALLHPADRVAWLAVFRSPLCGLTRADLLALTGEGPSSDRHATVQQLVRARLDVLSPDGQQLMARVWPVLQHATATLGRTPLSTHVERTWRSLGGDAPLLPDQHRNALRFLDLLRKIESGPDPISIPLLEHHLRKLYAEPTSAPASVELMTIHKAKGLEWDMVLVPALERGSGQNEHGLLKWLELDNPEGDADFVLAPIHDKGGERSSLSSWLTGGETRRQAEEAARLFYVACTRAREELHLFATVDCKADGRVSRPTASVSLLHAAWPAALPILERLLTPAPPENVIPFVPAAPRVTFALAASGTEDSPEAEEEAEPASVPPQRPGVRRLPATYDPLTSMKALGGRGLPYTPAASLPQSALFSRPEGSFAARAFGNTVHRFLQRIADKLAAESTPQALQAELPSWAPRLIASLRNEGLSQAQASAEAQRALHALTSTLHDPAGVWLLSPHVAARSEVNLLGPGNPSGALRADRVFRAGAQPEGAGDATHLWVVDYKTAEQGGQDRDTFLADQKQKYLPQMRAYAQAACRGGTPLEQIRLALYFPLVPALLSWSGDVT